LEIGPEGIAERSSHYRTQFLWSGVIEIRRARDYIFVMTDTVNGYVIPRRAFPSAVEEGAFLEALERFHTDASNQPLQPARSEPGR
jgi:hypothetical protein